MPARASTAIVVGARTQRQGTGPSRYPPSPNRTVASPTKSTVFRCDSAIVENLQEIAGAAKLAKDNEFDYISVKPFLTRDEVNNPDELVNLKRDATAEPDYFL